MVGVLELVHEAPAQEMLVVEEIDRVEDRAARDPRLSEGPHDLPLRALLRPIPDQRRQFVLVLLAAGGALVAGVARHLWPSQDVAQGPPHAGCRGDHVGVVVRPEGPAGVQVHQRPVPVAVARRDGLPPLRAARDPRAHVVGARLLHGDLHRLALAGALLLDVRPQQRQGHLHSRPGVADRGAGHGGRALGLTRHGERARRRLRHHVVALVARVGAAHSEALDAGVDDPRVHRLHHVVADVELLHDARAVVLHEDVVVRRHVEQQLPSARLTQVQHDAALVAVPVQEVGRVAQAAQLAPPRVAAARRLDLHDVGPHPGQRLRARGSRLVLRHVQDPHSIERGHVATPFRCAPPC